MNAPGSLVVRADAGSRMGTGHLMRCVALAQAWRDRGGRAVFCVAESVPALNRRLRQEGFEVVRIAADPGGSADAAATARRARAEGAACVVLDGYRFGETYQKDVRSLSGRPMMVVDDYGHAGFYPADWILNQNPYARRHLYRRRSARTRFLLGTRYALLRREFLEERKTPVAPARGRRILVTMGGTDPDNVSEKVIRALARLRGPWEARLIVGAGNANRSRLVRAARGRRVRLDTAVRDMPAAMDWCDLAVTAGGTTCWELACRGVPSAVIVLAENQRRVAASLQKAGAAVNLGWHETAGEDTIAARVGEILRSRARRRRMARAARNLVDGQGAGRVAMSLAGAPLRLRRAGFADARLLWRWANDRSVRAVSFDDRAIPWPGHLRWLKRKLADPACRMFVAVDGREAPVGQIRFEGRGARAVAGVSVDRRRRGGGLGACLIDLGVRALFARSRFRTVLAYVKPDNTGSRRAFEKAGFLRKGRCSVRGQDAVLYARSR